MLQRLELNSNHILRVLYFIHDGLGVDNRIDSHGSLLLVELSRKECPQSDQLQLLQLSAQVQLLLMNYLLYLLFNQLQQSLCLLLALE